MPPFQKPLIFLKNNLLIFFLLDILKAQEVTPFAYVPSGQDMSSIKDCMFTVLKQIFCLFVKPNLKLLQYSVVHDFHEEVKVVIKLVCVFFIVICM